MNATQERILMVVALLVLPALVAGFGVWPLHRRTLTLRQQIQQVDQEDFPLPRFTPPTQAERAWLEAQRPRMEARMPLLTRDAARLAHYHRVVSELQAVLQQEGIPSPAMRSSWDPIQASFTLPGPLAPSPVAPPRADIEAPGLVKGWVLEVQVPGGTSNLFRALARIGDVEPLLEPVGLRWVLDAKEHRQHLWLRNLVLEGASAPESTTP